MDSSLYLIYAAIAVSGIVIAEAAYLLFSSGVDRRTAVNRRIRLQASAMSQEEVLIQLRKERGLGGAHPLFSMHRLRELRVQSGLTKPLPSFLIQTTAVAGILAGYLSWTGLNALIAFAVFAVLCAVLPYFALRFLLKRRHKRFGVQLPEALELITRGLRAGHPVPVAISMVSREMADPIGSEFGIVADEITYGSDLITALHNLFDRVGHEDLPLFVTAVSIQNTTGGNLREVLDGLATVIRERSKLRRKVRAISAEGRISAYILTAIPALLFGAITVLAPNFYAEVWIEPLTWYLIGASIAWLILGNIMMFKMANFRI